jgi:hypothetical protein
MPHPEPSDRLARMLREQGATPGEIASLLPTMSRLAEWQTPQPTAVDTARLLAQLAEAQALAPKPAQTPIRQSIRSERRRRGYGLRWLLAVAWTQVSLFGAGFWLASALVTVAGAVATLGIGAAEPVRSPITQAFLLRASGPLLAYLGTVVAFRGVRERTLECELACPPSPLQLTIARLMIVLGYDVALGLALTLTLWAGGAVQVLTLTLAWFMPLLLVAGLALLLAQRYSMQTAAFTAYGGWLAFLALGTNVAQIASWPFALRAPSDALSDALVGAVGVALLAVALWQLRANLHHMLPAR